MKARKKCLGDSFHGNSSSEQQQQMAPNNNPDGAIAAPATNLRGRHTLDVKEFLKFTVPRQVVFFELGYDCASSNLAQTKDELEKSLYGLMLANTPKAFLHLLNRYYSTFVALCVYIEIKFSPYGVPYVTIFYWRESQIKYIFKLFVFFLSN